MAAVLTKGLTKVRAEFNTVFEDREKFTDGWLGDSSHASGTSGHNPDRTGRAEYRDGDSLDEVRAIDVDKDLVPGSRTDWMELVVQYLVKKARAGGYIPFRYLIYKRRIWRRNNDWKTETYTGANTHDEHLHASGDYTQTADNWNGTLGLASVRGGIGGGGEDDMEVSDLNAELRKPTSQLAVISRAIPWQYTGGGIPEGMSTLGVLNGIYGYVQTIHGLVKLLAQEDDVDEVALAAALAPAVAAIVTPALVAAVEANGGAPLTQAEVTSAVKAALREGTA
jgi:hypothetical protein